MIIEWSDYECPFCERAEREILPKINLDYVLAGKVQLVFRHLPLEKIHPRAMAAAQAAECAATQGRFWEMHAALFADQRRLDDASFIERADRIGVDLATFRTCLSGPRDPRISDDVTAAQALKLTGTPVFLIGVRRADGKVDVTAVLSGVKPVQQFIDVLGRLLLTGDRVPH